MNLLTLTLLAATTTASPVTDLEFLKELAETRTFMAGRPVGPKLTPDGKTAFFLRSQPKDFRQTLFALDVPSGQVKELLTPDSLLKGAAETLSVAERARLERQRITARGFTSYRLSMDGTKVLVVLSGHLYVFTPKDGKVVQLKTGEGVCIDAQFSPDGSRVAYVRGADLYVVDLARNVEKRVTTGGTDLKPHGLAEFVAQEEMGRFSGYWFSPDGKTLAYQETDQTGVEQFSMIDPMHPEREPDRFYYPRAGMKNAVVKLGLIGVGGGATTWAQWDAKSFPYVASVRWPKKGALTMLVQNREQTKEQLLAVDPKTGKTTTLVSEEDPAWLNLTPELPLWTGDGKAFFWSTERHGGPEIELHNADGSLRAPWVKPEAGFARVVGFSDATNTFFFSGGPNPTETAIYRVKDGGAPEQVKTPAGGPASEFAIASEDASMFVVGSTSSKWMLKAHVVKADGTTMAELPSVAVEPSLKVNLTIQKLAGEPGSWAAVIRPRDFVAGKKYPVILDVYGGPGHLQVAQGLRENLVAQWLANQGFIVVKLDGRGTPRRGHDFERAIKGDFATLTAKDQLTGLRELGKVVPEMDLARVGVVGWSFGGYLAALLTLQGDGVKAGVAGAPVVDWLDYDTHYTERYLGVPDPAAPSKAYQVSSLLSYVKDAKRPLLLIHGTADDNVYFMHTLKLSDAMLRAGKPHNVLPLTNFTHLVPDPLMTQRLWERIALTFKEGL